MSEVPVKEAAAASGDEQMTTQERERAFWLEKRHALIIELDAIEEHYLPDKRAETLAAREWLRNKRKEKVESSQT